MITLTATNPVLKRIFSFLSLSEDSVISCVCKQWMQVIETRYSLLIRKQFPHHAGLEWLQELHTSYRWRSIYRLLMGWQLSRHRFDCRINLARPKLEYQIYGNQFLVTNGYQLEVHNLLEKRISYKNKTQKEFIHLALITQQFLLTVYGTTPPMLTLVNIHTEAQLFQRELNVKKICVACLSSQQIAFGLKSGSILLMDLEGKLLKYAPRHAARINDLAFSDKFLISASSDNSMRIWDRIRFNCLHDIRHLTPVQAIAVHGNEVISGTETGEIRFWNMDDGCESLEPIQYQYPIHSLKRQNNLLLVNGMMQDGYFHHIIYEVYSKTVIYIEKSLCPASLQGSLIARGCVPIHLHSLKKQLRIAGNAKKRKRQPCRLIFLCIAVNAIGLLYLCIYR